MKSNCLLEAVKAKLKDWDNVEIRLYPPRINCNHFHFYWIKGDNFYHFVKKDMKSLFLFEGNVKEYNSKLFYSSLGHKMYMAGLNRKECLKLAKKYHLPFTEDDIEQIFFNEEND